MKAFHITLSSATGVPFYRQVVDQTAQMIQSGVLAPGVRLPSVRELAADLLVSLITIRRAYADLEAAGLITRRQGFGTFVQENIDTAVRDHAGKLVRQVMTAALVKAIQLGASSEEIRSIVDEHLSEKEN